MKLNWRKHPTYKDGILGRCDELPDEFCKFSIVKVNENSFRVFLPTMGAENYSKLFIMRDPTTARDFCEDFLNYNIKEIARNQINEMKKSNLKSDKPISHYERFLMGK